MEVLHETEENLVRDSIQNQCEDEFGTRKVNGELRKGKKKKDFCFYCESYVLNFARHIQRNHRTELEVRQIFSLSPHRSSEERELFDERQCEKIS